MKFTNSHKALTITLLIVGTLLLSIISIELKQKNTAISEMLVDITIEDFAEILKEENVEHSRRTNKGFNNTKKQKHFTQAYKTIAPPKDFKDARLANIKNKVVTTKTEPIKKTKTTVKKEEVSSFKNINSVINKRSNAIKSSTQDDAINKNSSIVYSLKNRTDNYLPIPIYLCDTTGKIVINITVNSFGKVTNTSVNTRASNSNNGCLIEHALTFAKDARFNAANIATQQGTITFYFEGKSLVSTKN